MANCDQLTPLPFKGLSVRSMKKLRFYSPRDNGYVWGNGTPDRDYVH